MRVWVLEHRGVVLKDYCWTGDGLGFSSNIDAAVWFVREIDARRVLAGNPLLDASPAEKELPERDEPLARSAAGDGAANPEQEA